MVSVAGVRERLSSDGHCSHPTHRLLCWTMRDPDLDPSSVFPGAALKVWEHRFGYEIVVPVFHVEHTHFHVNNRRIGTSFRKFIL